MGRKGYSDEFKQEAVKQVIERGYSIKEVSENLGLSTRTIQRWVQLAGGKPCDEKPKKDKDVEIAKLKAELKRVKEERDILKKAAVFFANNPE